MKNKFILSLLVLIAVFCLAACKPGIRQNSSDSQSTSTEQSQPQSASTDDSAQDSQSASSEEQTSSSETEQLSGDTSFTFLTVDGTAVENGIVTMTASQYDQFALAEDYNELVTYTIAEKAQFILSFENGTLTASVTAEDGTENTYELTVKRLNDLTLLTLNAVNEEDFVESDGLTEGAINALANAESIESIVEYDLSEGASVSFDYDAENMVLSASVTSEDNTSVQDYAWDIMMKHSFYRQAALNYGSDDAICWNTEHDLFVQAYSDTTVRGEYRKDGKSLVAGLYYSFGVDVEMKDAQTNAEFMIEQVETKGSMLRYYIRYIAENDWRVYTDFVSYSTGFKGFREIGVAENGKARMDIVRHDNTFLMFLNGKTVWRQTLAFGATEVILGGEKAENRINNITSSLDYDQVKNSFEAHEYDYLAPLLGACVCKTDTNNLVNVSSYSGTNYKNASINITPNGSTIYRSYYYHDGSPLAGQYLSFEATFNIGKFNNKTNPSLGFYICGGNSSNGKIMRAYLRRDHGNLESADSNFQLQIDNGGTNVRIRYYSNVIKLKMVFKGTYTYLYANDVLVLTANEEKSFIADNPEGSSYKEYNYVGVTGYRQIGITCCGADCTVSDISATTYDRILSGYETKIQNYQNMIDAGIETGKTLYMGSSFIEYWNTKHDFSTHMDGYNIGLAGSHSTDWLQLIDRIVTPFAPSKIVMYLGGNDASAQGNDMAPYVAQSVKRMLNKIHEKLPDTKIYWISLITFPGLNESNDKSMIIVDEILSSYASETSWLEYLDIAPTITPNGVAVPEYYEGSDGVHMNAAGYAAVETLVKAALGEN